MPFQPQQAPRGVRFEVRVVPRSTREGVMAVHDGALKIGLSAPAVEGAANAALIKWLARALGVTQAQVSIVRGEQARLKLIEVSGSDVARVRGLVPPELQEESV